ncbi:GntR family transcriptional regulator [Streptomyces lonarensis]|uniref:GntR family transcriptional regulator n=1 Tax=Streptomyces lonarensis TaxID=700599 RepID=A0A7X6CXH3_9ACTN|nr:GntR family transcriptional regulator [Streptomyces lonarensis]NJQ04338.1 GntR family transcriptional regulator [Streptomyces lonarensis]
MGTTHVEQGVEPKHRQLKTVLSEALETEFAVGQVLPNERELAARFGVARATLRQALEQLELDGRLQRRRGVGTTVAPPRTVVDVSASPDAWPGGPDDDWEVTGRMRALPPLTVARLLGTAPGELVETVHRYRGGDGRPVAVELLHVPQSRLGGTVSTEPAGGAAAEDVEEGRRVLRRLQRFALDGLDRSVELGSATDVDAGRLGRLPGAPVLVVTSQYVVAGKVAAVGVATYRADTCRLTIGDRHS